MEEDGTAAGERLGILGVTQGRVGKELWKMWVTSVDGEKGGDYGKLPLMVERTGKGEKTWTKPGGTWEEKRD